MKFPNCQMELWKYLEDSDQLNEYGETKKLYDYIETVPCNFQTTRVEDSEGEYGTVQEDRYNAYFEPNVGLHTSMVLRIKGETDTYEILGKPILHAHIPNIAHKKTVLQRHQKPITLEKLEKKRRLPVDYSVNK